MDKNFLLVLCVSLVASVAAPTQAASTIIAAPISTALNPTLVIFNSFTTETSGNITGSTGLKSSRSFRGFAGGYLQVNNGTFAGTLATPAQAFSFLFQGLPTTGASLSLNFVGGTSETFDLYTAAGNQTSGRLTIHRNGGTNPGISSVVFGSGSSAASFNIDSLASAAPEPAAWGLLMIGFGMAGAALRRRADVSAEFRHVQSEMG
jgi:hypothetical protein